jgi:DNA-binding FadR family transcriptional regulator
LSQPGAKLFRGRVADQIVGDLRRQILSGELADGARLPSERELAAHYDVSAPTIREAIRVLTVMGLLNARNGSRTTVIANADTMLRLSIASVAQFERMGPGDVLGLLGAHSAYAAELAVEHATDGEIEQLRAAAEKTRETGDMRAAGAALHEFSVLLAAISHNPLVAALCRALSEIQIGIAVDLSGADPAAWYKGTGSMYSARLTIVDTLARRDPAVVEKVRDYYHAIVKRTRTMPGAKQLRGSDPDLTAFLSAWLGDNIRLDNTPGRS